MIEDLEEFQDEHGMFIYDDYDPWERHSEPNPLGKYENVSPGDDFWIQMYAWEMDIPSQDGEEPRQLDINAVARLISSKLAELGSVFYDLVRYNVPEIPIPRFPKNLKLGDCFRFELTDSLIHTDSHKGFAIVWTAPNGETHVLYKGGYDVDREVGWTVCAALAFQPGRIVRFLHDLDRLITWIRKRLEGRARHINEILKQQRKSIDELEARVTLEKLRRADEPSY